MNSNDMNYNQYLPNYFKDQEPRSSSNNNYTIKHYAANNIPSSVIFQKSSAVPQSQEGLRHKSTYENLLKQLMHQHESPVTIINQKEKHPDIQFQIQYPQDKMINMNSNPLPQQTKTKTIEGNFPIISQSQYKGKDNQFNKTATGGLFPFTSKVKKTIEKDHKDNLTGNQKNRGKTIEVQEDNNDSFLNEVVDLLKHVEKPSENNEKQDNKIEPVKEEEVDPRINFEKINELNKQRPLTSYGGLMARKKSLQNSLRQQSSKNKKETEVNIEENLGLFDN